MPHRCKGQDGAISCEGCAGPWSDARISGKLHKFIPPLRNHQLLLANKILAEGP
jgi:hypothetical protein